MKHYIVGTAGHVDHGKSTLIRALTGTETDRLPEEKERGLSIDLGFAHLELPGGVSAGIVDVPGHQRFLKNMLAGVGGYDLGMLVVDAQEGVMPQTREHVEILQVLQTRSGMTAVTKIDTVDPEFLELVEEDLRDYLRGTFLDGKPIVRVSAVTGEGLDPLKATLGKLLSELEPRDQTAPFRMPVDRSFIMSGFGTVVTGSLWSGTLRKGDRVEILPLGLDTRVRGLQVHGREVDEAVAGQRVAVNLAGVEPGQVTRGQVIAPPGLMSPAERLDVRLEVSPQLDRPVKQRAPVRFYAGTRECLGHVHLLEAKERLLPGENALVQLVLDEPAVVRTKDRFVVRDFTSSYTLGGGTVLELAGGKHRRGDSQLLQRLQNREEGGTLQALLSDLERAQGGVRSPKDLARDLQLPADEVEALVEQLIREGEVIRLARWLALAGPARLLEERFASVLRQLQDAAPHRLGWRREELLKLVGSDRPKLSEQVMAESITSGKLQERSALISTADHQPRLDPTQQAAVDKILGTLRDAGFSPPAWKELSATVAPPAWRVAETYLLENGEVVKLAEGLFLSRETLEEGKRLLRAHIDKHGGVTPSEAREVLGSTRKYVIPLLEYYDQVHFTQRKEDVRVLGSRA
ncbi:MAG: selenocysteine-specific translation elongation factor [Armatimonadetes bacterium]|nr:selenocysteine-specific translation elongation factor [Armatimonadota bacterium]